MPAGDSIYFIKVNKELRILNKLNLGQEINVAILKDESKYGMPLPEEMKELLTQDPEGENYFNQLTPGKQRGLLYLVGKMKSSNKRIEKSLIILGHLKEQCGQLDYKILHEDFKSKRHLYWSSLLNLIIENERQAFSSTANDNDLTIRRLCQLQCRLDTFVF